MITDQLTAIIVAALSAGGVGALLSYLIARRRTSGQVATTDADRLWQQNDKLIDAYARDNGNLRDRALLSDNRIFVLETDNRECTKRTESLEAQLRAVREILDAKIETAKAEAKADVAERKQEIAELKQANGGTPPQP